MKGIFLLAGMLGMTIAGTYSATAKAATPSEVTAPAPTQNGDENEADFGGCKYYCGAHGYTTAGACAAACGGRGQLRKDLLGPC